MDTAPRPDREAALERVAADLGDGWPHCWSMRHRSKDELLEDRPATGSYSAGPLATQLATFGVRLIADARRGLAAAGPDIAAAGAAALLLSLAEDYYLYLGSFAMYDDPTCFDRHTVAGATATPRGGVRPGCRSGRLVRGCRTPADRRGRCRRPPRA